METLFSAWSCMLNIPACAEGVARAVPADMWFWIGFVLGAVVGRWGLLVVAVVVGSKFIPKGKPSEVDDHPDLFPEDVVPPVRKPRKKKTTLADLFKRGAGR